MAKQFGVERMTIPRNSKSYPYLAIAQHYNVDYGKVLLYSEKLIEYTENGYMSAPATQWRYEVWRLERGKLK